MEDLKIGFYGLLVVNIVLGFLFGAFPLIAGIVRGQQKRGILGFVLALAGGALLGIFLSFPLALIFVWLIVRDQTAETAASSDQASEQPLSSTNV